MRLIRTEPTASEFELDDDECRDTTNRNLTVKLDEFAWEAITREAERLGVATEDLARFSMLYYLADLDSGRVARRLPSALAV